MNEFAFKIKNIGIVWSKVQIIHGAGHSKGDAGFVSSWKFHTPWTWRSYQIITGFNLIGDFRILSLYHWREMGVSGLSADETCSRRDYFISNDYGMFVDHNILAAITSEYRPLDLSAASENKNFNVANKRFSTTPLVKWRMNDGDGRSRTDELSLWQYLTEEGRRAPVHLTRLTESVSPDAISENSHNSVCKVKVKYWFKYPYFSIHSS